MKRKMEWSVYLIGIHASLICLALFSTACFADEDRRAAIPRIAPGISAEELLVSAKADLTAWKRNEAMRKIDAAMKMLQKDSKPLPSELVIYRKIGLVMCMLSHHKNRLKAVASNKRAESFVYRQFFESNLLEYARFRESFQIPIDLLEFEFLELSFFAELRASLDLVNKESFDPNPNDISLALRQLGRASELIEKEIQIINSPNFAEIIKKKGSSPLPLKPPTKKDWEKFQI
jgi:hypothetical protein